MNNNYTVKELKNMCKKKNIKGYTKLNKKELINLLKKGGSGGILKKPKKVGRFSVEPVNEKNITFNERVNVYKIKENDCPKDNRVKQYKVYDEEGKRVRKIMCPPGKKSYTTKNGYECCKTVGGAKSLDIEKLNKLTKDIKLEDYEGFFDDDMGLEFYDEMIENGTAFDICRGTVTKTYLRKAFEKENVNGYIALKNNKKIGFIIYYKKNNTLYLDVVCTSKSKIKGLPLGQLLLYKMEEYAKKQKYKKMTAESVPSALSFYKKLGWKKIKKVEDKYLIEKDLTKKNILKKIKNIFK